MPSVCTVCKRNTKYSGITCGKSVCVRVECSIAEENEDTLGWEASKSVGFCLPCAGAAEFFGEDRHPSDDIEPAAWEMNLCTRNVPITVPKQLVSSLMKPIQARMKGFKALKKE